MTLHVLVRTVGLGGWKAYLAYLDDSPYSLQLLTSSFAPEKPMHHVGEVRVEALNYTLWPFQQRILDGMRARSCAQA